MFGKVTCALALIASLGGAAPSTAADGLLWKAQTPSVGGAECFRLSNGVASQKVGNAGPFTRYDYTLVNKCPQTIVVELRYGRGGYYSTRMDSGETKSWFCTMGFFGNIDCPNGEVNYTYRSVN